MSQPKNLLKSLNSKPGDLATKFISIDGKPMMARRSATDTQPSRVESLKPNVEEPSKHDIKSSFATVVSAEKESTSVTQDDMVHVDNGSPTDMASKEVVSQPDPIYIGQATSLNVTGDVSLENNTSNVWSRPSHSFVEVVSSPKPNPKRNFRTLFNEDEVENTDFVLSKANVVAAQNKFAN